MAHRTLYSVECGPIQIPAVDGTCSSLQRGFLGMLPKFNFYV